MDRMPVSRTFVNSSLPSRILNHLYDQAASGTFTDVIIHAGGKSFACHRALLSASSPVFNAMFTTPMRERSASEIQLHDVDATVFRAVRAYTYGRPLVVHDEYAIALSAFVRRYQIMGPELVEFLDALLTSALTLDNVLAVRYHADAHGALRLRRNCDRFITVNMKALAMSPAFLEGSVEVAVSMLQAPASVSRNSLSRICAQHVLAAALAWLAHDQEGREQFRERVMRAVDVEYLSLSALVRASRDPAAVKSTQFQARLLRAFAQRAEHDLHFGPLAIRPRLEEMDDEEERRFREHRDRNLPYGRVVCTVPTATPQSLNTVYHTGWGAIGTSAGASSNTSLSGSERLRSKRQQNESDMT